MLPSKKLHSFWSGKRVLLTGHTGFKGSWAAAWLMQMGAKVHGFALAPDTDPNLHDLLDLSYDSETIADLRDRASVADMVNNVKPELVLHFAAQPLVRRGYREPVETMATNIMGTAHLLDALRDCETVSGILVVTSDKAYDNDSYDQAQGDIVFREGDPLGGRDPYSASKGCQEIVARSFEQSYFRARNIPLVTARAGNVVGGGDWSEDRLMTDIIRAASNGKAVELRNPGTTRPWQHVIEPVAGYLMYLQEAVEGNTAVPALNFGPKESHTVQHVTRLVLNAWGSNSETAHRTSAEASKEARTLALDSSLATTTLSWQPRLDLETCVQWIVDWHKAHLDGQNMHAITEAQISSFESMMDTK
ncbi:MAG: CDP-glucose 4,6-dehydratase [Thalassospira sp.]|uniref:CDP-glucose 4,6-dehydratase n=1 Tax=Thalassospira sp. TaxID=1912094 RepID=UPI0032F0231C